MKLMITLVGLTLLLGTSSASQAKRPDFRSLLEGDKRQEIELAKRLKSCQAYDFPSKNSAIRAHYHVSITPQSNTMCDYTVSMGSVKIACSMTIDERKKASDELLSMMGTKKTRHLMTQLKNPESTWYQLTEKGACQIFLS